LEIALDLGFLSTKDYSELEEKRQELAIMLGAFIKGIKKLRNFASLQL